MFAAHDGNTYTTKAQVHGLRLQTFEIGHTLPQGATVGTVTG